MTPLPPYGQKNLKSTAILCLFLQYFSLGTYVITPQLLAASVGFPSHTMGDIMRLPAQPYVLKDGESPASVAIALGLSLSHLQTFNQFRTFHVPFEQLRSGDEIDIPVIKNISTNSPSSLGKISREADEQETMAANARQVGSVLTEINQSSNAREYVTGMAREQITGTATEEFERWFSQYGTASMQLNTDNNLKLDGSSLDILVPLYDNGDDMLFTQFGARHRYARTTLNTGLGVRLFQDDWMFGINTFFDDDITGKNHRLGIGTEAWTDYLKLSANSYIRLSDWHKSRDFADYDERPANGFDISADAWLPALPQLGGKLKYEQYYGRQVALSGPDHRQHNPKPVTLGVNYTPVPLISIRGDYRMSSGWDEMQFGIQLNYNIGRPWGEQINPDLVGRTRLLASSRTDVVNRNNEIVLEYRKHDLVRLSAPAEIRGTGPSIQPVVLSARAKYGVARIDFIAPELDAAVSADGLSGRAFACASYSAATCQVQLPAFNITGANSYPVTVILTDTKGNSSSPAHIKVIVTGSSVDKNKTTFLFLGDLNSIFLKADSISETRIVINAQDAEGLPVSGLARQITFTQRFTPLHTARTFSWSDVIRDALIGVIPSAYAATPPKEAVKISQVNETAPGVYEVNVKAGDRDGEVVITPLIAGENYPALTIHLVSASVPDAGTSTLTASPSSVMAGQGSTVTLVLKDVNGNAVTGMSGLTLTGSGLPTDPVLTEGSGAPGTYTTTLTPTVAGMKTLG
ncbi:inverse autotransporter beta domain-containing protein, partial [Enterobacter roggenkampii]|uniref:inverse autotransporter beta domain-containing protein n=1 Tax=Enterobacter roggenkampii TaxID=1812935 RepID=UPI002DB93F80